MSSRLRGCSSRSSPRLSMAPLLQICTSASRGSQVGQRDCPESASRGFLDASSGVVPGRGSSFRWTMQGHINSGQRIPCAGHRRDDEQARLVKTQRTSSLHTNGRLSTWRFFSFSAGLSRFCLAGDPWVSQDNPRVQYSFARRATAYGSGSDSELAASKNHENQQQHTRARTPLHSLSLCSVAARAARAVKSLDVESSDGPNLPNFRFGKVRQMPNFCRKVRQRFGKNSANVCARARTLRGLGLRMDAVQSCGYHRAV
uniref:Uncharacterized protein n=1 Tax=Ixodes ricinus TaxID=34613 RepID=A0A6B0V5Q6_IXORI